MILIFTMSRLVCRLLPADSSVEMHGFAFGPRDKARPIPQCIHSEKTVRTIEVSNQESKMQSRRILDEPPSVDYPPSGKNCLV